MKDLVIKYDLIDETIETLTCFLTHLFRTEDNRSSICSHILLKPIRSNKKVIIQLFSFGCHKSLMVRKCKTKS